MIKTYTKDTLTREVLEKGVKLRVIDEQHSAAFQRACFDLGVFWAEGDKIQHTSKPYIFVVAYREKQLLKYANNWEFFRYQPETEIYFDDERVMGEKKMESTIKNTGGLAFPRAMTVSHGACADHQEVVPPEDGMTLRDYFAAKAMQAIISGKKILIDEHWHDRVAIDAYEMADAMLKEREQLDRASDATKEDSNANR